jgi:hypothetical protein
MRTDRQTAALLSPHVFGEERLLRGYGSGLLLGAEAVEFGLLAASVVIAAGTAVRLLEVEVGLRRVRGEFDGGL